MAQALLLSAVSLNFGLRLLYHAQQPAIVYNRYQSEGDSVWSEGITGWPASIVSTEMRKTFRSDLLNERILLSMELYCAAQLEENQRTRFITIVSALEPLAETKNLGADITAFVDRVLADFVQLQLVKECLRNSLKKRISDLRDESVGQSLDRLCDEWFPDRADVRRQIKRAYDLRSKLLHRGVLSDPKVDLASETDTITKVLRSLYQRASGYSFHVDAVV